MNKVPVQLTLPQGRKVLSAAAFVADMKAALRALVEESGLSRDSFVDAMNEYARLADRSQGKMPFISRPTLDKLLSDEDRGQLPTLWQLEVMCRVAESLAVHERWLSLHDCGVMDATACDKVRYAEETLKKKAEAKTYKSLERKLLEKM